MEKMVRITKGNSNNSVIIEQLELFTEEKNVQSVINVLELVINTPGYINLDFADIINVAKDNNAYSVNYMKIKKPDLYRLAEEEISVKGILISLSVPSSATLDMIDEYLSTLKPNFGDATILLGTSFSDNVNEIEAEILEFYQSNDK